MSVRQNVFRQNVFRQSVFRQNVRPPSCFHTISRFRNFHSYWYNCISTRKMFYIC
jgi:hypothetical protein